MKRFGFLAVLLGVLFIGSLFLSGNGAAAEEIKADVTPSATSTPSDITFEEGITSIRKKAYAGREDIRYVIIPDGVVSIGDQAFAECKNLKRIYLPESVQKIGKKVFSGCGSLSLTVLVNVKVSKKVLDALYAQELQYKTVYEAGVDGVVTASAIVYPKLNGFWAFDPQDGEHYIYQIVKKTDTGGEVMVNRITTKKSVFKVPDTVVIAKKKYTVVGVTKGAFKDAKTVKKITLGSRVKKIGKKAFLRCKNLKVLRLLSKTCSFTGKDVWKGTPKDLIIKVRTDAYGEMKRKLLKTGIKEQMIKCF